VADLDVLPAALDPILRILVTRAARIASSIHPVQQTDESGPPSDEPDAEVVELSHG